MITALLLGVSLALLSGCLPHSPSNRSAANRDYRMIRNKHVLNLSVLAAEQGVVTSVTGANSAQRFTEDEIASEDRAWIDAGPDGTPLMMELLNNETSQYLRTLQGTRPRWAEIFLVDGSGCLTATSNRTSDYYQGDEEKWSRIFEGAAHEPFVSDIAYDESTQLFLHHYSIPIRDRAGDLCGVLVVGISE